ncbi:MAG: hypothetical protein ACI9TY_001629 [Alphaproteobacteria bacterium]|jgi:hypothetical protein
MEDMLMFLNNSTIKEEQKWEEGRSASTDTPSTIDSDQFKQLKAEQVEVYATFEKTLEAL